ncbi:MAG: CDGSH iron-sulfur domain-containing protein [Acidiferrobacteraceae bacterium]
MAKITMQADGPYLAEDVEVFDKNGKKFRAEPGKPIALCRCGASANKPFCDGAHRRTGFKSSETVDDRNTPT